MLVPLLFPSSPYVNLCCKIEEIRVKLRSPCLHITRMGGKGVLCACICVLLLLCVCVCEIFDRHLRCGAGGPQEAPAHSL